MHRRRLSFLAWRMASFFAPFSERARRRRRFRIPTSRPRSARWHPQPVMVFRGHLVARCGRGAARPTKLEHTSGDGTTPSPWAWMVVEISMHHSSCATRTEVYDPGTRGNRRENLSLALTPSAAGRRVACKTHRHEMHPQSDLSECSPRVMPRLDQRQVDVITTMNTRCRGCLTKSGFESANSPKTASRGDIHG